MVAALAAFAALLASLRAFARALPAFGRSLPGRTRSLPALARSLPGLLLAAVRRIVAPSRCAACDAPSPPAAPFCPPCARSVEPAALAEPAEPAEPAAPDVACAVYGGAVAAAVRRFKYGARPDLAHPLGQLLRAAVRAAAVRADLVVPVPLHPRKLRDRGYNQAALLASAVASELRAPLSARALARVRPTAPQASLGRAERLTNLAGTLRARSPAAVRGRHVVLVDDVCTTGATLEACRAALLAAGAARVTTAVLAVARDAAAADDP